MSLAEMLRKSVWGRALGVAELEAVVAQCHERPVGAGQAIVRAGEPALHWIGLVSGVACMSVSMPDGKETSLTSLAAGGWFGEGTLIKRGHWQYDGRALTDCQVALMPIDCFEHLRQTSLPFNHYLQQLMGARMGGFIAKLCVDRLLDSTARIAQALAGLYQPEVYPDPGPLLHLSQAELGQLAGVSRQRTNIALQTLERTGLVSVSRRGIRVLDLAALRAYRSSTPAAQD